MLRKLSLAGVSAICFFSVNAQDTTKSLTISGAVDAYYRYHFSGQMNNYTSFTNSQSSFELGMATVRADASAMNGKVGATIDLGYGRRAEEFSYNDGVTGTKNGFLSLAAIKQAFVTYAPSSKIKFTMGKFATHVGYELLDAPLNRNYSMSYMFTNGPFFHAGLKADMTAGPVGFMIGVTNYTDQTTSTTTVKNFIAQFSGGTKNGKLKFYLNYSGFGGSDQGLNPSGLASLHQYDAVVTGVISPKFNIGYNGTIQSRNPVNGSSGSWNGNALYLNFDPTEKLGITLRSEFISDKENIYFTTNNIFANTISFIKKLGPLTIIPELRFETAEDEFYIKGDGSGTKSSASGLLAVVYKF
jgi:Putative beta-barrel porin-2, OmpL-like. bbp2